MESGQEREKIIELTEVAGEAPASSGKKDLNQGSSPVPEKKNNPLSPQGGIPSSSYDAVSRATREAMRVQAEDWTAKEGTQILDRVARSLLPRIAHDQLTPEIEKLKAELTAVRAQREEWASRVEQWLQKEGADLLKRTSHETVPGIVADELRPEREKAQKEMENLQNQRESLSGRIEQWLSEIQNLQDQAAKVRSQTDELPDRVTHWFEMEGKKLLAEVAREIFPRIAEEVLRQEIAKLKEEARAEEKE